MKKIFLAVSSLVIISSCKEQVPTGLVTTQSFTSTDTTNVLSVVPSPQLKKVFIEEFTGVRCANCPYAAMLIDDLINQNPNRIIVTKVHSETGGLSVPIYATDPDFRNTDATALAAALGQVNKPEASFDRLPRTATNFTFDRNFFTTNINLELPKTTPVNIDLTKQINTTNDTIYLKSTFTFTDTTSQHLAYNIYLVESNVVATQDSAITVAPGSMELPNFNHREILRKVYTPVFLGSNMVDTLQEKGRFYTKYIPLAFPSNVVNKANCKLIVFINNRDTHYVLQAQEIDL